MLLTLSKVAVGTPTPRRGYDRTEPSVVAAFLKQNCESTRDWRLKQETYPLLPVRNNLGTPVLCHQNIVRYLELCWSQHLGAVIRPDDIWYTILCELAGLIIAEPEKYRHLFSETTERQEIIIQTDSREVVPLDRLSEMLAKVVPMDAGVFFPEFTTSTPATKHAMMAAFCEMGTPYYDYSMMCCGIPTIDVRGTAEDWDKLAVHVKKLQTTFGSPAAWFERITLLTQAISEHFDEPELWREMFKLEHCGSGSDVLVDGWWPDLYVKLETTRADGGTFGPKPEVPRQLAMPRNFPPHVSKVPYKDLPTQRNFVMKVGLFASTWDGTSLIPEYGYIVYEKLAAPRVQSIEDPMTQMQSESLTP